MALKKPSDLFDKTAEENNIQIIESDNTLRDELSKVENLSEQVIQLQQELSQKVIKNDLESLVLSQINTMQENFEYLQNDFKKSNKKDIVEFKEKVSELTEIVGNLVENELPKYKKQVTKNEVVIDEKFNKFIIGIRNEIDTKVNDIAEVIDTNLEYFNTQLQETSSESKKTTDTYNKLSKIVENRISKENEKLEEYSKVIQSLHKSFIELEESLQEKTLTYNQIIEEKFETISSDVNNKINNIDEDVDTFKTQVSSDILSIKADVVINEQHIKNVDKYIQENYQDLVELKEEVFGEIEQLPFGNIQENLERLEKKIDYIKETYSKIEPEVIVREVIKEGLLNEPPDTKNSDPLTPLDQNFVTLDQLQQHYRLFINRIQQQISTIGGGGETRLKYLDDIVGIATNASAYDGKYLKYNHSLGKFEFTDVYISNDSWADGALGPYTLGSVGIGTTNAITQLHLSGFSTTNSNLKIGSLEFQNYSLNNSFFGDNVYWNGSAMVRRSDGKAGLFYFIGDEGQFRLSPVGLANSATVNNPQFKINSNGGFGIGSSLSQGQNDFTGSNFYVNPDGIVLVGTISSTGTASQRLQVTGGAYVSGNLGIGTTNPTSKLHVVGDVRVTGVVTATTFVGALTGTATSTTNIPNLTGAITSNNTTTSLGSFSSANLSAALTDETGSGAAVFATSPTLVTPVLGAATATSINASGIITATQLSTGASGTGVNITTDTISGPATLTIDPAAVGDNTGAVRIKGDLYVDGTQFIVNSTTIELADFNVGIATTVGTNALLDGAGIGIGSTSIRKTLTWSNNSTALKSSEDFDVASGKVYKINGTSVLSNNTLGSGVVNSSLTSVGTLTNLNVGNINSTGIITATTLSISGIATVGFITATNLYVSGVGTFLSSGLKIRNPANTFDYTITGGAIGADRVLNLPVLTTNSTIAVTNLAQSWSGTQTFNSTLSAGSVLDLNGSAGGNHVFATNQISGTIILGGTGGTGAITLGQATTSQTTNIQAGVTASGNTKTINFGTGGASGSFTQINIGPTAGVGTVVINSGTNLLVGTATSTGTASQRLQVDGGAYVSGSVGIGTTNPQTALDVRGAITIGVGTVGINSVFSTTDIQSWYYTNKSKSVSGDDSAPAAVYVGASGTAMFMVGDTGNDINQYTLSTPYDVSTAGVAVTFFSTATQEGTPNGIDFNPTGTKMFISGITGIAPLSGRYVHEYSLSTAWTVSSAGYTTSYSVSAQDTTPQGVTFGDSGSKMYVVGSAGDTIYQYSLSTPYSLASGVTYDNISLVVGTNPLVLETSPSDISFNSTGTVLWVVGNTQDRIYEFRLGTAWNISTAVFYDDVYVGYNETGVTGLHVIPEQNVAYIVGTSNDIVFQYSTNTPAIEIASSGISSVSSIVLNNETRVKDKLYVKGLAHFDTSILTQGNIQVDGTLTVSSSLTVNSTVSLSPATGNITLSPTTGNITLSPTTGIISLGTNQTTGTLTIGGATQTGAITLGQATTTQTVGIATGVSGVGTTKTINLGTGGASGSFTQINIGPTAGVGTVVINSGTNLLVGSATSTGTASQPLQVTGGAYVSGSVGIGTTNPRATLQVKDALAFETTNTTTSSTSQVAVDTFATATFRSAKYQVQMTCPGQIATLGGITTGGSGYTAGTFNVTFSNSSGTGAAAQGTLTISNGTVSQIGLGTTGGSGYTAGDVLTAAGGSGLQVSVASTASPSGRILTLGAITSAGIGYTAGVGVGTTTLAFLGGTGTGAVGLATIFDGVITSSTLLQQPTTGTGGTVFYSGSNYTTSTVLTIAKTDVTNTITTITGSVGVSTFTSLTAHGIGVSDTVRVSSTSNGLTAGTNYFVVTTPTTTTFTLGSSVGIGTTFTTGSSLSIGFYRNSANAGGSVAYLNAITGVSTNFQVSDLMVLQNGTTADFVEYGTIANNDVLGTFAADISGANTRLLVTPTYATNTVKVARQAITV